MNEEYPKRVVLEDKNLYKHLEQMNELVLSGRELSVEIEELEKVMADTDQEIQAIEKATDMSTVEDRVKDVVDRINALRVEQDELQREIRELCMAQVPKDLIRKYEDTKTKKEELETQRNKVGLKIQKVKDKSVPLARKLIKPHLTDKYDDYNGVVLENGELVGTVFNHLTDFKQRFEDKLNNKYKN